MSKTPLLKPLIVATESEIRKKIFSDFNLNVSFIASEVDEDLIKENFQFKNYYDLAIELASAKALEVSKKNPDNYVLGVDQVCEFNNEILNKPGNKEKCINTLQKLSGNTHFQNCGMAIAFNDNIIWTSYDVAKLTMNELSLKDIEDYILKDTPYMCCGSYKYELNGKDLFSEVKGSIYTIQGLDIDSLLMYLRQNKFIWDFFQKWVLFKMYEKFSR